MAPKIMKISEELEMTWLARDELGKADGQHVVRMYTMLRYLDVMQSATHNQ